jgi:hypothetical protein
VTGGRVAVIDGPTLELVAVKVSTPDKVGIDAGRRG